MATIKMTPEELRNAAAFIGQKRGTIVSEVNALKGKVNQTAAAWEGASKSQFIDTFTSKFLPMLEKDFPRLLEGIEQQLKGAADAIEMADQEVAKAFK